MSDALFIPTDYSPLSGRMLIRRGDKVPDLDYPGKWRAAKDHEIGWRWYTPHFISRPFVRPVRVRRSRPQSL